MISARSRSVKIFFLVVAAFFFTQNAFAATDVKQAALPVATASKSVPPASSGKNATVPATAKTETLKVTAVSQPVQVAMVKGDYHKYEALNWQNRGYSGGVKDLSIQYASGDDVTIDAGGRGIIGNGDYKGYYSLKDKDVGYVDFDFSQFRKYYDTYGGIWNGNSNSLSRDLFLDIGHIGFEAGITMPDLPNVSVYYDHDYKTGSKSMLNWDTSTVQGVSKKISPSWEEINETTDTFGIKADHTHDGYHLTGDQRWEISRWKTRGYEVRLNDGTYVSTTGGAGGVRDTNNQRDQRRQDQVQETNVMTTMLGADKWYWEDKVFASSAYRFQHLKNQDRQNIQQFSNGGSLSIGTTTSATAANYNRPDGSAHNEQNLNSWVLNLMVSPWSWLSGTGGFKAEVAQRDASSYFPSNNLVTTANGIYTAKDETESNTYKFAESFGLRFKAIPRTAVYSDLSFEQSQNHLMVNSTDINQSSATEQTGDRQTRDAIIDEPVITWATGADFQPFRFLNLTSQVRLREKTMNFHDKVPRITPWQGQVFMEKLNTNSISFTQRATAKLSNWSQTSFRYLLDDTTYDSQAMRDTANSKARMLSNSFIYDISVYPVSNLSMTGSFSQIYAETKTVQSSMSTRTAQTGWYQPAFTSNSSTWMFATDYQPHKKVSLDSSLYYTLASNNNRNMTNQNNMWVNYAADYDQLGLTVSCKWDVSKDLSVTPQYGFQRYLPNEKSGIGGAYDAQILSLGITATWG